MPRSLYQNTIMVKGPAGAIPLAGAAVTFRDPVDGLPIAYPLYADGVSLTPLTLPYVTGVLGELEVWADLPHRVRIDVVKGGLTQAQETIDLEYPPEYSATTEDITQAIEAHEAKEDPHDQYLTQDEADLAYLKLTGGTVTGQVTMHGHLVSPLGYRIEAGQFKLNSAMGGTSNWQIDQAAGHFGIALEGVDYFVEIDGTGSLLSRHKVVGLSPDAGNTLAWNANGFYAAASASYPDLDSRYEQLSRKGAASGYVPLGADTKIPNAYLPDLAITNTFVVTSEAEMLALVAQTGDVAVRLDTTENYILAAEPATVLANWTKLAASTTAGNTTIVKREEFAPAAASTSVALQAVPTQMLSVSRNGVEQSQPAGHYTVAGVTVTFTDAFVAGERVSVVYEVGSSAPAPINGYTKVESDARYEPIDTMYTKAESDARYLQPSVAATTYLPLTGGTLTGDLVRNGPDLTNRLIKWQTNGADRWRFGIIDTQAEGTPDVGGDLVLGYVWNDGTYEEALRFDRDQGRITYTARYGSGLTLQHTSSTSPVLWARIPADAQPRFVLSAGGAMQWGAGGSTAPDILLQRTGANLLQLEATVRPNISNAYDLGVTGARYRKLWATDTDLNGVLTFTDATLQRTGAGALRVDTHLGVGVNPALVGAGAVGVTIGQGGMVVGATGTPSLNLSSNSYWNGSVNTSRVNAGGATLLLDDSGSGMQFRFLTAPAVAPGAAQTFTTRASIAPTGTLTLTPDSGIAAIIAGADAGLELSSWGTVANIIQKVPAGALRTTTAANSFMVWRPGGVADKMRLDTTGTLTLTPDANTGGFSTSVSSLQYFIANGGVGGLRVNGVSLELNSVAGAHCYINAGSAYFLPTVSGGVHIGHPSVPTQAVYSNTGTIQSSTYDMKEDFSSLDPALCATAVLETDWVAFSYKPAAPPPPEVLPKEVCADEDQVIAQRKASAEARATMLIETAPSRQQKGYVLQSPEHQVHDLFGLPDRKSASPSSDLAVVACALQEVLRRLAVVEGKLA